MNPTDNSLDQHYTGSTLNPSLSTPPVVISPTTTPPDPPPSSLSPTAPVIHPHPDRFSVFHFNRNALLITVSTVSLIALVGLASFTFNALTTEPKTTTQNNGLPSSKYAVSNLPLNDFNTNGQLLIRKAEQLAINGQLLVNSTLSASGLTTLSGGATITGPTTINTTGASNTAIGNPTGKLSLSGATTIGSTLAVIGSGGLTIGNGNSTTGKLILQNASNASSVSLQPEATQTNNLSLTIPTDPNPSDSLCLAKLANCTAVGTPTTGDLTGTYPSPSIGKLQNTPLLISTPTASQVLQYNGTTWVNTTLSGDITTTPTGTTTIGNGTVTGTKLASSTITNTNLQTGTFPSITGTGPLTTGSIATGFGTIATTNNITTTAAVQGGTFIGSGSGLTNLNGSNISTGTIADTRLSTNVTLQGNTFNGASQLVQLNVSSQLPAVSGVNLTALNGSNIASGTVADARLSTNVTLQGNAFNGISQLVQTTAGGILPTLSGANLTALNGSNISTGTIADARHSANVTLQGNTFNGISQLVQTTAGGILPILSGANLTALNASNIASGTVSNTYLVNSGSLTITAGSGLSGGGLVALGGITTLTNSGVLSVTGTTNQVTVSASTGAVTFSLPQNIAVTSSPTFTGLTLSANLTVAGSVTAGSYTRSCGAGYVPVPGNPKFGTSDFCVMKYDASNDGVGNAVSVPNAAPWVSISQITAEDTSRAAGGHLLSEAEWMTIATNALWVNANWCSADGSACGNAPGTAGKILAAGHNDNSPAAALVASSDDTQACFGTITAGVNTVCGSAGTQKRTLTLSNGSVIWDFGGNVWQWTTSWIIGNEEPTATPGFAWREFTALTRWGALNYANPTNRGWNSTQGLGQIYSDGTSTNNTLYGFLRGGDWGSGSGAGAVTLN